MTPPSVPAAERRTMVFDVPLVRRVSWVIWPIDGLTGHVRRIELAVTMTERPVDAPVREVIVNLSGALVFDDLPPGDYAVTLRPVGADAPRFFPIVDHRVTLAGPSPTVEALPLWPRPGYPFSEWRALVRGRFLVDGQPYAGATIEQTMPGPIAPEVLAELERRKTLTTESGEYALSPYTWEPLPLNMLAPPGNDVSLRVSYTVAGEPKTFDISFPLASGMQLDLDLIATE
jgi:hypothetical protein